MQRPHVTSFGTVMVAFSAAGPADDAHHRLPRGRGGAMRDPCWFALSRVGLVVPWVSLLWSRRTLAHTVAIVTRFIDQMRAVPRLHLSPRRARWTSTMDAEQALQKGVTDAGEKG
jgi:hypothetical protein